MSRFLFRPKTHQFRKLRRLKLPHVVGSHLARLQHQHPQVLEWLQMLQASTCHPGIWDVQRNQQRESCIYTTSYEPQIESSCCKCKMHLSNRIPYQISIPNSDLSNGGSGIGSTASASWDVWCSSRLHRLALHRRFPRSEDSSKLKNDT